MEGVYIKFFYLKIKFYIFFFSRKKAFLICGLLYIISSLCFVFCRLINSVELLVIGRFIVGLGAGLTTSTIPLYLAELVPLRLREKFSVLSAVGITGGIVLGQLMSLSEIFGTADLWEYALSFYGILVALCLIPYWKYPESPKFLYMVEANKEEASKELIRLRGKKANIDDEFTTMDEELGVTSKKRTMWSVITDKTLLLPLVLVCTAQAGQQLSGVNAVTYYSVQMFESTGLSSSDAKWANLGSGLLSFIIACFSSVILSKINRRTIFLTSCLVTAFFLVILTIVIELVVVISWFSYASIAVIFGFTISFQLGLGPIPFFIGCEIVEMAPRSAAMSLGSLTSWFCNFTVAMIFPALQSAWGAYVFLPFAGFCIVVAIIHGKYLPETRGKDVSEVVPLVSNGFRSKIK